jgi:hypothetical protein
MTISMKNMKRERDRDNEKHNEKHEKQIHNRTHRMENLTNSRHARERENEKHEYLYMNIILERVLVIYVPHSSQMVYLYLQLYLPLSLYQ